MAPQNTNMASQNAKMTSQNADMTSENADKMVVNNYFRNPSSVRFPTVTAENPLTTNEFIEAYYDFTNLYEMMGTMFIFVRRDQRRLLEYIKSFHREDLRAHKYIRDVIALGKKDKSKAMASVVWLKMSAHFIVTVLMEVREAYLAGKPPKIGDVMYKVYKRDVSKYHGMITRQIHTTAFCYLMPNNDNFFRNLCYGVQPTSHMDVLNDMNDFLKPLQTIVAHIQDICDSLGIKDGDIPEC